jgi:hypothetical protein
MCTFLKRIGFISQVFIFIFMFSLNTCDLMLQEPSKVDQPRPLVRPSSANFCQHFFNLSRETVPLKHESYDSCCRSPARLTAASPSRTTEPSGTNSSAASSSRTRFVALPPPTTNPESRRRHRIARRCATYERRTTRGAAGLTAAVTSETLSASDPAVIS